MGVGLRGDVRGLEGGSRMQQVGQVTELWCNLLHMAGDGIYSLTCYLLLLVPQGAALLPRLHS